MHTVDYKYYLLALPMIYFLFFGHSVIHCMNINIHSFALHSLAILSQTPILQASKLKPELVCYQDCIANCTDYISPLCHLDYLSGPFAMIGMFSGIILLGIGSGFFIKPLARKCLNKNRSPVETSPILDSQITDIDL